MPGKKKSSASKKKEPAAPSRKPEDTVDPDSRMHFVLQIQDLEYQINRYQEKCDELTINYDMYHEKFEKLENDRREDTQYLNAKLKSRDCEIAYLKEQVESLNETKEQLCTNFETKIKSLETEIAVLSENYEEQLNFQKGKVAALEEFRIQKEDLMASFADMETNLKEQEERHKEEIYQLEKKQVIDKDRLKKEMINRVNDVAAEFRKASNKQIAETTKRTIKENVSINAQLMKMSEKTKEEMQENENLKEKDREQRMKLELVQASEKEFAKRSASNQKLIKMLTDKCKQQELEIAEFEAREDELQNMQQEHDVTLQELTENRENLDRLISQMKELQDYSKEQEEHKIQEWDKRTKLEEIIKNCADSLKESLQLHLQKSRDSMHISQEDIMAQKQFTLENLLQILNTSEQVSKNDYGQKNEIFDRKQMGEKCLPKKLNASYRPGDLGVIPRSDQVIHSSQQKMMLSANESRFAALTKLSTKSVTTQTLGSKATLYVDQLLQNNPNLRHSSLMPLRETISRHCIS